MVRLARWESRDEATTTSLPAERYLRMVSRAFVITGGCGSERKRGEVREREGGEKEE